MPANKATASAKAKHIQKMLIAKIDDSETPALAAAQCSRVWLELEEAKREWRGKPKLKPMDAAKLQPTRRRGPAVITEANARESLYPPPPVPTPPTPAPKLAEAIESEAGTHTTPPGGL